MIHGRFRIRSKQFVMPAVLGHRGGAVVGMASTFLLIAGCHQGQPAGQVIASVNGEEITIPEMNTEARARGLTIGDNPQLRDRLLHDLIDRKLLVQLARQQRLDRTPEHLLSERRATEILLTQELLAARNRDQVPTPQELAAIIRSNPRAFDGRVGVEVDQILVSAPLSPGLRDQLNGAKSLDGVGSLLAASRMPFSRGLEIWDSAVLPAGTTDQLVAAQNQGVVLLPVPEGTIAAHVLSVIARPTPASQREQVARELLQSQRAQTLTKTLLEQARASATIRYQPDFGPGRLAPTAK